MARQFDVVVVGAGVIGLCAAYYLARAGRSVCVLDQTGPGAGASFGNCGMISPSHVLANTLPGLPWRAFKWMFQSTAPFRVVPQANLAFLSWMVNFTRRCTHAQVVRVAPALNALLKSSRSLFSELLQREQMRVEFEENGCLYVYATEQGIANEVNWHPLYAELGVNVRILDNAQLIKAEPELSPKLFGACYFPDDAKLRPDLYIAELTRVLELLGVEIRSGVRVDGVSESANGVQLSSSAGRLDAGAALLAAGSWSPLLSRQLGFDLPIQPGKGYSITMPRPARCVAHAMVLKERSVVITPWPSGMRLGSTMEFAGYDSSLNPRRLQALTDGANAYLNEPISLPTEAATAWFGWRPMTPDTLPIIGPVPNWKKLWLATGHSMLGVSMSTGTGKLISELMLGQDNHIDARPYAPSRFLR